MCDDAAKALIEAKAQGIVQDSSLGGALAGGEIPHAQVWNPSRVISMFEKYWLLPGL
jgi:hypothetical protein